MYKPEITTLINENFRLDSVVGSLIRDFEKTSDIASLEKAEEIQEEMSQNQRKIERLRGNN